MLDYGKYFDIRHRLGVESSLIAEGREKRKGDGASFPGKKMPR